MIESGQTEPMKVYELAKELGVDSLSLLDQLKSLNIQVKNHMSELTDADIHRVREANAPKKAAGTAKKAPSTRKKAAAPAPAESHAGASITPPASSKTTAPKRRAAPASAETATGATAAKATKKAEPAKKTEDSTAKSGSSSTVIRRRLREDGATETVTSTTTRAAAQAQAAAELSAEASATAETLPAASQPVPESAPFAAEEPTASEIPLSAVSETAELPGEAPLAPPPVSVTTTRKVTITPAKLESKSMLRVVSPAAPKPLVRTTVMPTPLGGTRSRPGGVVLPGDMRFPRPAGVRGKAEEEAELKKSRLGEKEGIKPEDVRFADYRKTEKIFLPKRKKIPVGKSLNQTKITQKSAHKRVVEVNGTITVADLAAALGLKATEVVRKLMGMGQMVGINQALDLDTATLVATEYQYEVKDVSFKEAEHLSSTAAEADKAEHLIARPPVVTIMGHVDHGKTTLLDSIREANVAGGEAGGITQHIGAYTVEKNGKLITFIDTPGHEAFSVMRARGANVTDIVILVVSADDGVMPQTREALSHAQAAKVPIVVAVNKIDKPGANPEKIKQGLAELNLLAEDWGGETMFVPVSALQKTNLDKLLEAVLLQAEVLDLKANPDAPASGTVLESRLEKGRGPVASLLVKRGSLSVGDWVVTGTLHGKVKAMVDHHGDPIERVMPGMAAEVLGLDGVANAGEPFHAAEDEPAARKVAEHRKEIARGSQAAARSPKMSLDALFAKVQAGESKELRVILKADVFGSCEAVRDSLLKLSTDKVKVNVIHSATGGITESDVMLASAAEGIIIGFNVRPETSARKIADSEGIEVKTYTIIYELIDDVKKAMTGLLDKKKVEKFLGRAEVRQVFSVPKVGTVAGCAVIDGKIVRNANVRLLRSSRVIFDGKLSSLKRFKDDAKEVAEGYECGMGIEGYNDIKVGDLIEAYQIDLVAQELDSA